MRVIYMDGWKDGVDWIGENKAITIGFDLAYIDV